MIRVISIARLLGQRAPNLSGKINQAQCLQLSFDIHPLCPVGSLFHLKPTDQTLRPGSLHIFFTISLHVGF